MEAVAKLEMNGQTYTARGSNTRDALNNLSVSGFKRSAARLHVSGAKVDKTVPLLPSQTAALLSDSPLKREIAVKQTAMRFE